MGNPVTFDAESDRLYLQALSEEHLQDYHAIQSNKLSAMWSSRPPTATLQETIERFHSQLPTPEQPWNRRWVIMLKDSEGPKPKVIGNVGIVRVQEIGYKLLPEFWGKGYMSEALKAFLDMFWADEANKKYDEIIAKADPENLGSTRVLEKAGFRRVMLHKEHYSRPYLEGQKMSDLQEFCLARPGTGKKDIE